MSVSQTCTLTCKYSGLFWRGLYIHECHTKRIVMSVKKDQKRKKAKKKTTYN